MKLEGFESCPDGHGQYLSAFLVEILLCVRSDDTRVVLG